jgi:hypothetical protein
VVFFGDSYTFGEGVNDDETFPYQVGLKTGGHYAIYNFAYSGYGPHQMLAALQDGRVERVVRCTPTHFIFFTSDFHIGRSAGLTPWDTHGPRFAIGADGKLFRNGNFDTEARARRGFALPEFVAAALDRSYAWQRVFGRERVPSAGDFQNYFAIYLAIIRESERLTRERFPGSKFHVLLWDASDYPDRIATIEQDLRAAGIAFHELSPLAPDYRTNRLKYIIGPHEGHPNAWAHQLLADFVAERILGVATPGKAN